ncbi:family 43 glycosylhydrolase [Dysgonomonas sp. BGC7]|uniref:family 43 glycosylhydrolase n=1 Tax=Dysgonomonas sp. BGC7 TaxID=1658008 RepID=UPI00067FA968|nr:family 43 glycosylhydrolase [Dysgonomonas sp. BGC7]MBD8388787.1 family 43 glycosylhydrolase [Dysgonomonas sp. BGC7]
MKHLHLIIIFLLCLSCGDSSGETENKEKPYLSINTQEKLVANPSGFFNLYITSNTSWKIETNASWLRPEKKDGTGNATIKIVYDENSTNKRTGIITLSSNGLKSVELTITQSELTFTNPIAGIPDPWIIKHKEYYYICKAQGDGINISRSGKLSEITATKSVWKAPVDKGNEKPWNVTHVWAPELHRVDGRWYIYYAAGRPKSELGYYQQRSGVLRAKTDDPMGEWEDMGMLYTGDNYQEGTKPTIANTYYAIDLGVFNLNKQLYAVWSGYPEGTSEQILYIAKMSNPYTISSKRHIISRADQYWELVASSTKINEGPAFLKNKEKNKFFVVYSCNGSWTKNYRLGYVMLSDTLKDPTVRTNWTKSSASVFTRCDETSSVNGVNGVGHCSFTKSPDETEDWIVYHVKNRNDATYESGRSTFMQSFKWKSDGTPDFGTPVGWGEKVAIPSGESH